jgi:hypothetical protein
MYASHDFIIFGMIDQENNYMEFHGPSVSAYLKNMVINFSEIFIRRNYKASFMEPTYVVYGVPVPKDSKICDQFSGGPDPKVGQMNCFSAGYEEWTPGTPRMIYGVEIQETWNDAVHITLKDRNNAEKIYREHIPFLPEINPYPSLWVIGHQT